MDEKVEFFRTPRDRDFFASPLAEDATPRDHRW